MKTVLLALAIGAACATSALAQSATVTGKVTKVDASAQKLTIDHGAMKEFDMPAMTMVFRAADDAMLKAVKAGDRVKFTAERVNGQFTVTKIEKAR
jgi:Cu/Ag efflux protein CusF